MCVCVCVCESTYGTYYNCVREEIPVRPFFKAKQVTELNRQGRVKFVCMCARLVKCLAVEKR